MSIPMVDLLAQYAELRGELDAAVAAVLASGTYVLGPQVRAFEAEAAAFLGAGHAVGVASGTDALHLALRALGIGPGDEVITSPFTFIATAEAIAYTGARPVFVDIDPRTYTLDPDAVARAITRRTRAVLAVHLYGQPADLDALGALCRDRNIRLVEDAAQAFGAKWHGARVGAIGDIGCFSFYPSKNLGALGDGGLVVTGDPDLAERVRRLREHGHVGGYRHVEIGYNSRLDELQAAVLRVKLRRLDTWNDRRRALAVGYAVRLGALGVEPPFEAAAARHVYHQYTVRLPRRDAVRAALTEVGIGSNVYYPIPVHRQPSFAGLGTAALPEVDHACADVLSLPIHAHLSEAELDRVCATVGAAIR